MRNDDYIIALANLSRTVADYYIVNLWRVTILCSELFLCVSNELVVEFFLDKVDGTSTKANTHDSATSNTVLFGNVVKIVELLARNFVLFR